MYIPGALVAAYIFVRIFFWHRSERHRDIGGDGYFSLMMMEEYKKNGHRPMEYLPRSIIPQYKIYPSLGIYLFSFLDAGFVKRYAGLMNSVIDLAYLALLLFVLRLLQVDPAMIMITGLTFIFLPTIFNLNQTNPIHFDLSWRDLGRFLSSLYFLAFFLCALTGDAALTAVMYGMAAAVFILIYYSSQFALQAAVFGSAIFSVLTGNAAFFAVPLAGSALIALFDGKGLLRFYRGKINHMISYYRSIRHTHTRVAGGFTFSPRHLTEAGKALFALRFKAFMKIASQDPLLRGLMLFPIQVPVAISLYLIHDQVSILLLQWYLTAVILWFLTLSKALMIFGEPDRYLEFFGYFPILAGLGYAAAHQGPGLFLSIPAAYLTCALQALYGLYGMGVSIKDPKPSIRAPSDRIADMIRGKNVYPVNLSHGRLVAYAVECNVLLPPFCMSPSESAYISAFPYPNWKNFRDVCSKYDIEYIVSYDHCRSPRSESVFESVGEKVISEDGVTLYKVAGRPV
ncbi:hypothetical protein ACFL42_01305 [Candidatus Omnitrophota bacterium]